MADIFISYASENRERAHALADVLEAHGWSVWWDKHLKPGPEYDTVIQTEVRAAGCVVVLWSEHSTGSRWVRAEADDAAQRNVLVPAMIERVEIPLGFRMLQAADLTDWEDGTEAPGIRALLESVTKTLRRSRFDLKAIPSTAGRRRTLLATAAAIPVIAGFTLSAVRLPSFPLSLDLRVSGLTFRTDRTTNLLGGPIDAARLVVSGTREVKLPAGGDSVRAYATGQLVLARTADSAADLTLAALIARDTGVVTINHDRGSYVFSLERTAGLAIRAAGSIDVRGEDLPGGPVTFNGDSIGISLGDDAALAIWPDTAEHERIAVAEIPIRGLALQSEELHALGAGSESRTMSTVLGGAVSGSPGSAGDTLAPGQMLRLHGVRGTLTRLELTDGSLRLLFDGRVTDARIGESGDTRSMRPTVAGWLLAEQKVPLVASVLGYLGILVGLLKWKKRP